MQKPGTGVHDERPRSRPRSAKREPALLLPPVTPVLRSSAIKEELVQARELLMSEQQQHISTKEELAIARQQFAALQKSYALIEAENDRLQFEINRLETEVQHLTQESLTLQNQLDELTAAAVQQDQLL